MEGLAALSLAANIVQFLDFARTLISASRDISTTGNRKEYVEYAAIVRRVCYLTSQIQIPEGLERKTADPDLTTLYPLVDSCSEVSKELIDKIEKLTASDEAGRVESFHLALKGQFQHRNIERLRSRVDRISKQINRYFSQANFKRIDESLASLKLQSELFNVDRTQQIAKIQDTLAEFQGQWSSSGNHSQTVALMLIEPAQRGLRYSAEQIIVTQLYYNMINARSTTIDPTHQETFQWVFDYHIGLERATAPFLTWLSPDEDLFWITGIPGSGKSTIMKFLRSH